MLYSLIIILVLGYIAGMLFTKIKLPKIIGMIIIGIVLGTTSILSDNFLNYSDLLRKIALVIILTKAGLSIDFIKLKNIGLKAVLMCFIPAFFEICATVLFAPLLLGIDHLEALLLGSVLAAVSPAIIVPRMIKYKEEYEGESPDIILAGSSVDDILVVVIFYSILAFFKNESFTNIIIQLPISIVLGVVVGLLIGFIYKTIIKKITIKTIYLVISIFITSILLISLENVLINILSYQSLISIIIFPTFLINYKDIANIKNQYNKLWFVFEIILFVLVGVSVDITLAFDYGLNALFLLLIILFFRSIGVILCLKNMQIKEKMFCVIAYLPKATVQASIGAIPLANNVAVGSLILSISVLAILITAPLGAILLDNTTKKLLVKKQHDFL